MKRVLFVSATGRKDRPYFDPSVRYRCFNFAQQLKELDYFCRIISLQSFFEEEAIIDDFDVFVFHRPKADINLLDAISKIRASNKIYVADYDDLIFDNNSALKSSIYVNGHVSKRDALRIFSENSEALKLFENFIVSTEPLKDKICELVSNAKVIVSHNFLSKSTIAYGKKYLNNETKNKVKTIGYFSGTKSHDHDLSEFSEGIAKAIIDTNSNLKIVGPVQLPDAFLNINNDKISTETLQGYHDMLITLSKCDVVIAPLQSNVFTACKSGLKYFESGIMGAICVATPIPDIDRFSSKYLYKPKNSLMWCDCLKDAIEKSFNVDKKSIFQDSLQQASAGSSISKWIDFIECGI